MSPPFLSNECHFIPTNTLLRRYQVDRVPRDNISPVRVVVRRVTRLCAPSVGRSLRVSSSGVSQNLSTHPTTNTERRDYVSDLVRFGVLNRGRRTVVKTLLHPCCPWNWRDLHRNLITTNVLRSVQEEGRLRFWERL